jgi:hypothetical protein
MVTPSVGFTTDLNNDCGGATTSLGTMQYIFWRFAYWLTQSVSGTGAAVITRSSNGSTANDTDLVVSVGPSAVTFGASGSGRTWLAMTLAAGYGNISVSGSANRLHLLLIAEDSSPATPISIAYRVAPNPFTGGSASVLPTATGQSGLGTFNLRSNTTTGAFRANFWKDASGNIAYMGKRTVEANAQAGLKLLDPVASAQPNRFCFLTAGATPSNVTSWLVTTPSDPASLTTLGNGALISVATGLTTLTNGIDNTGRMPMFPFTLTFNAATVSGGRLIGVIPDILAIGGAAANTFNYGDPTETGTMRYRTMGCFALPCPIGTVLE